jgi:hypothetical protein
MSSGFDSYPLNSVTVIHVIHTEKTTQRGALWSVLLKKYYSGRQSKKNEMSGACVVYVGNRRCIHNFGGGRDRMEDLGVVRE